MRIKLGLKLIFSLLLIYTSTSGALPVTTLASKTNNNLGFKIMRETLKLDGQKYRNRFFSPISAHVALSMALNGTRNITRENFLKQLGYPEQTTNEQINSQNKGLIYLLTVPPTDRGEHDSMTPIPYLKTLFTIQNSAWTTNGKTSMMPYDFSQEYLKDLMDYYGVENAHSLDFLNPNSVDTINAWVKKATSGMIPEIINHDLLKNLLWVLLSTTYMEAQWDQSFVVKESGEFNISKDKKINTPTIKRVSDTRLSHSELADVAELNFRESKIKAFVVLPRSMSEFATLQNETNGVWTETFWGSVFQNMTDQNVLIEMPKFSFADEYLLKEDEPLTKSLGFNFLFKDRADFTRMDAPTSPPSKLNIIKQNTKIEWDEKGVKAAAATLIGGSKRTNAPRKPEVLFKVDRPFYFAIYNEETQSFLFVGQVVDPR